MGDRGSPAPLPACARPGCRGGRLPRRPCSPALSRLSRLTSSLQHTATPTSARHMRQKDELPRRG